MALESLISLIGLALAGSWTPGPNNALLANSGATFGFRRTMPHALGVALGFPIMIFGVGLGLGSIFEASALLQNLVQWGSVVLLLWLAYKIWTTGGLSSTKGETRPFTFIEAAAFQWVNPKAWVFAISVTAQFVSAESQLQISLIMMLVFLATTLGSALAWSGLGQAMQHWLKIGRRLTWFNRAMALLMVLSVGLLFLEH